MNLLDPLHNLDFKPTCDYPGCNEVAYRMHRPPCRCFVVIYCLPHILKARLEMELAAESEIACPVCGVPYATELLEQRLPTPNP